MPVDDGLSSPRPRPGARARAFGQEPGAGLGEKKKKRNEARYEGPRSQRIINRPFAFIVLKLTYSSWRTLDHPQFTNSENGDISTLFFVM